MLNSMDLCQLVNFPTHQSGNTLDHIIARSNDTDKVEKLTGGNMLADHNWVLIEMSMFSLAQKKGLTEYSKLSGEVCSQHITEVEEIVEQVITSENLEQAVHILIISKTYEYKLARSKYMTERPLNTWFSSDLKVFT